MAASAIVDNKAAAAMRSAPPLRKPQLRRQRQQA